MNPGEARTLWTDTVRPLRPGVYRFRTEWTSNYSADNKDGLWKGELSTNWVELEVKPVKALYDQAEMLTLTIKPRETVVPAGKPHSMIGTLKNEGSTAVTIAQNVLQLNIRSYDTSSSHLGTGPGDFRKLPKQTVWSELGPGAELELTARSEAPAVEGQVKVRCFAPVYLKVNGNAYGTVIYSVKPANITVTRPEK